MKKLLMSLMLFAGIANAEKSMGVPQYGTARSVKVCATYPTLGSACGTGLLLGQGQVLTEHHIMDTVSVMILSISTNGIMSFKQVQETPDRVIVLRHDEQEFAPALILKFSQEKDLALLRINDDVTPAVIFEEEFHRGQEVFVIGNPVAEDFRPVKTNITGVYLFKDKKEVKSLIMVDSKKNRIKSGFSGGGIFSKSGGLLGMLEVCGKEDEFCAGMSAKYIKNWLEAK